MILYLDHIPSCCPTRPTGSGSLGGEDARPFAMGHLLAVEAVSPDQDWPRGKG